MNKSDSHSDSDGNTGCAAIVLSGGIGAWVGLSDPGLNFVWTALIGAAIGFVGGVASLAVRDEYQRRKKDQAARRIREENAADYQTALNMVSENVQEHLQTLVQKYRVLIRTGDYGETVDDDWQKEVQTFLKATTDRKVFSLMHANEKNALKQLGAHVDQLVRKRLDSIPEITDDAAISNLSGIEYEGHCARVLESNHWEVSRTPPTGDNGVDLVATKAGRKVVFQCKKYNSPVGNKAIQEVYSGKDFFNASEAVVVSNAQFTEAAQQAANKLSVRLIHHSQLSEL